MHELLSYMSGDGPITEQKDAKQYKEDENTTFGQVTKKYNLLKRHRPFSD